MKRVRLFAAAALISFAGSLPVGTLNAGVSGLVIAGGVRDAIWFGVGAILVEVGIVRIALWLTAAAGRRTTGSRSLVGLNLDKDRWHFWLHILACAVIFSLAYINLSAAWQQKSMVVGLPLHGHAPFVSGLLLSLLNPLHLPYWMGWTAVLKRRGWMHGGRTDGNIFVLAIGLGTALAFVTYGVGGRLLIPYLRTHGYVFNWAVGAALAIAGVKVAMSAVTATKNPASP